MKSPEHASERLVANILRGERAWIFEVRDPDDGSFYAEGTGLSCEEIVAAMLPYLREWR